MSKMYLTKMPVANLGTLALYVIDIVEKSKIDAVVSSPKFAALKDFSVQYQQSLFKKLYSDITKEIESLDAERDKILSGFRDYIDSQVKSPLPVKEVAGKKAKAVLERFGTGIERMSYVMETQYVVKIIEAFRAEDIKDAVNMLALKEWIDSLETAQKKFDLAFQNRSIDDAEIKKITSASELRKDMQKSLDAFLAILSALILTTESEEMKNLDSAIQQQIEKVANSVKSQTKPSEAEN